MHESCVDTRGRLVDLLIEKDGESESNKSVISAQVNDDDNDHDDYLPLKNPNDLVIFLYHLSLL